MGFYENHVLPHVINLCCGTKAVRAQRANIVPGARGKVLEVGMGPGLNMPYYDPALIDIIYGLEPNAKSRSMAAGPIENAGLTVDFIGLDGQEIPLDKHSVDTIVLTYTLCTIPDADKAMREMRRVLKPGGRLLFSEHGAAPDAAVKKWQDRINSVWNRIGGGCNLNRDIPQLIKRGGFAIDTLDEMYLPGPKVATYNYRGAAS